MFDPHFPRLFEEFEDEPEKQITPNRDEDEEDEEDEDD